MTRIAMGGIVACAVACGGRDVPDGQRCVVDPDARWCTYDTVNLKLGLLSTRNVHFEVPVGQAPAEGWPAAVLFQGSFHPAAQFWSADAGGAFGAWHQTATVHALLDAGWAVITPNAQAGGHSFWNTNVLPWSLAWEDAPDDALMDALFEAIEAGTFGPVDPGRVSAAGISSGGYMTSRMALSYPGRFERLAIHSASWATCSGLVCALPEALPPDHPPTLFLHGEGDDLVPIDTMERYAALLADDGFETATVTDPDVGHAWIPAASDEIVEWFSGS